MTGRAVLLAASLGLAGSAIVQTLLANATPRIAAELADPAAYAWVSASYLIASAATVPFFAQLVDRVGCRRIFLAGHTCFALGAVGVAAAPTLPVFLAARVAQGVGAGAIAPAALASISLVYVGGARTRAMGQIAVVQVVANVVGPLLGGWFIDGPGWRFGALAPVPFSLVVLALTRHVPTRGVAPGWWRLSLGEQGRLLRGSLLRYVILAGLAGAVGLGTITYAPIALQDVQGLSATATGWLLAALLVAMGVGSGVATRLDISSGPAATGESRRRGPGSSDPRSGDHNLPGRDRVPFPPSRASPTRVPVHAVGWGLALVGAPLVAVPVPGITASGLALVGLGVGVVTPLLLLDAQRAAPQEHLAQAGGLAQLGRTVGAASAVPVLGLAIGVGGPLPTAIPVIFGAIAAIAAVGLALNWRES